MNEFEQLKNELSLIRQDMKAINENFMSCLPQEETALKDHMTQLIKAERDTVKRLEVAYLDQIGDPAGLLKDAESIIPVYLDYCFGSLSQHLNKQIREENGGSEPDKVILIKLQNMPFLRFDLYHSRRAKHQRNKGHKPSESLFLLDSDGMKTCINKNLLSYHLAALKGKPEEKQLKAIIRKALKDSPYIMHDTSGVIPPVLASSQNLPVYHGQALTEISRMTFSKMQPASGGRKALFYISGAGNKYELLTDISKLSDIHLSTSTHALMNVILGVFTRDNMKLPKPTKKNPEPVYYETLVKIPADEYFILLGYDLKERVTDTAQEAEQEKRRIYRARDHAKREVMRDLKLLKSLQIEAKVKRSGLFMFSVFQAAGIDNGFIYARIGTDIAKYLAQLPKTHYPLQLVRIARTHPNAYRIGQKMAAHYNMKQNRGTNYNRLSVASLLAVSDLPSFEDLQKEAYGRRSLKESYRWKQRLREPLETILNNLTSSDFNILHTWKYSLPGGGDITREEVNKITDFYKYAALIVTYELTRPATFEEIGMKERDHRNDQNKDQKAPAF